jgi:pSer/pThr/pTyr-binding forkhead associated (FHA) protein
MDGPLKGQRVSLDQALLRVGRREGNDWILQDGSVSGSHCEVERSDSGFLIRDLGSTNGTKVNSEPIKDKQLFRNDIIQIGEVSVMLEGEDVPQTALSDAAPIPRTTIIIPQKRPTVIETPKVFVKKSNSNKIWIAVITVLLLVIVGFLVVFFKA